MIPIILFSTPNFVLMS
jgi:hypothetical protein